MKHKLLFRIAGLLLLLMACLLGYSFRERTITHQNIKDKMKNVLLNANDELIITASENSKASDFDFLLGTHKVRHKRLKTRLVASSEWEEFNGTHKMEQLLNGIGNLEQHLMCFPEGQIEGMALRLFNPATRLWSIHWADSISGKLDVPMVGSFKNNVGFFYARDHYQDKPILVQFKWDVTNKKQPVWSQAFSMDKGETWEWNWHMHFSKENVYDNNTAGSVDRPDSTIPIGVIELRNYGIKHGLRDSFIHYFEENFIQPQEALKGYLLGQYRVKGYEDNFCWIRGFKDMQVRSSFLPAFYYGPAWKQHKSVANSMLANNDNVYLLQPLLFRNDSLEPAKSITSFRLIPTNGIAVVEFYTANTKLDQLLKLFAKEYLPLLKECGINDCTLWTSVLEENDFPRLPVFQDKNLLVSITFYKNELDYDETMKKIDSKMTNDLKARLQDVITIKNTMILYPSEKTISQRNNQKPKP
jgi:hypothetical protein